MLPADHLPADLREAVAVTARQPIAELLLQRGILRQTASDLLLQRLRDSVTFTPEEEPLVLTRLWEGVPGDPPASLLGDWIATQPELIQGPLRDRWNQIRLQKWIETTYKERLEPYFLERRADLEQVVYGMIRLRNQGAAEELYLRLLDDDADFGSLARTHSLGEERYTRGLVGPMLINQPHATIRAVLDKLTVGEVHPPFRVDNWVLLVQMEHRLPASLTDATRMQLYNELFQRDLEATLDEQLQAIYTTLLPAPQLPPEPAPVGALPPVVEGAPAPEPEQAQLAGSESGAVRAQLAEQQPAAEMQPVAETQPGARSCTEPEQPTAAAVRVQPQYVSQPSGQAVAVPLAGAVQVDEGLRQSVAVPQAVAVQDAVVEDRTVASERAGVAEQAVAVPVAVVSPPSEPTPPKDSPQIDHPAPAAEPGPQLQPPGPGVHHPSARPEQRDGSPVTVEPNRIRGSVPQAVVAQDTVVAQDAAVAPVTGVAQHVVEAQAADGAAVIASPSPAFPGRIDDPWSSAVATQAPETTSQAEATTVSEAAPESS